MGNWWWVLVGCGFSTGVWWCWGWLAMVAGGDGGDGWWLWVPTKGGGAWVCFGVVYGCGLVDGGYGR